jgi:hypothetical protein
MQEGTLQAKQAMAQIPIAEGEVRPTKLMLSVELALIRHRRSMKVIAEAVRDRRICYCQRGKL